MADLAGLLSGLGQAGAAYAPYALSQNEVDLLAQYAADVPAAASGIAETAAGAAEFVPFSVKTATGAGTTITTDPTTGQPTLTYGLGTDEAALQTSLLSGAKTLAGQTLPTATSLYEDIRAMQLPEEARQAGALRDRLFAQGRGDVQTARFGGTPEELAMAKAIAEADTAAKFQATQLAPQLQQAQIQNLTGMLGAAYLPQQQAMAGLMPGIDISRIAQAARQGETEALYRGGIAGLEAQAAGATAAANVEAARTQALANALSGMFAKPDGGGTSAGQDFFSALFGSSGPTSIADTVNASFAPGYSYAEMVEDAAGGYL
jgi:hypothetical protein